jgi:hypothetical protein
LLLVLWDMPTLSFPFFFIFLCMCVSKQRIKTLARDKEWSQANLPCDSAALKGIAAAWTSMDISFATHHDLTSEGPWSPQDPACVSQHRASTTN